MDSDSTLVHVADAHSPAIGSEDHRNPLSCNDAEAALDPTMPPEPVITGRAAACVGRADRLARRRVPQPGRFARLWPLAVPLEGEPKRIMCWLDVITGMELDEGGAIRVLSAQEWFDRRRRLEAVGGPPVP